MTAPTTTQDATPLVLEDLIPREPRGRLVGMGNLVRRELATWGRTRRWWTHLAIWLVVLNLVAMAILLDTTTSEAASRAEAVETFVLMLATAVGIGVVVTVQGAIVGEREMGTAAWIISKPVARRSLVLAKFAAHAAGFLAVAVAVPTLVFVVQTRVILTDPPALVPLLLGVAVACLSILYYLALSLALGTIFSGRGPVAGIGMAMLLGGLFLRGLLPPGPLHATPWPVGDVGASIALGTPLEPFWWVSLVTVVLTTIGWLGLAVRRFEREEL